MRARNYQSDPARLLEQGREILLKADNPEFLIKVLAVTMVLAGVPASLIAQYIKYTRASIWSWVKAVDESGYESLRTKHSPGRPPRITTQQRDEINRLLQNGPTQYGYQSWNGASIADYIYKNHGIRISSCQCRRIINSLGYFQSYSKR